MSTSQVKNQVKGFLTLAVLKDVLIVAAISVVTWKLINSQFNIDFEAFSFNDFLSLVLALFSVALSVAFYFKANEASNQFYDNSYKFTKDMSEILGRIEAGFGEKLKHLDEGYSGVRDRLDKIPIYSGATVSDVQKEEEEVKIKEENQQSIIDGLMQKAQLATDEKALVLNNLSIANKELEEARSELRKMRSSSNNANRSADKVRGVIDYIAILIAGNTPPNFKFSEFRSIDVVRSLFDKIKTRLPIAAIDDMLKYKLVDSDENLTDEALVLLQSILINTHLRA